MNLPRLLLFLLIAISCGASVSCSGEGITLQGAGATFPAPLYKRWFLEYYRLHPEVRVNYQAIGSGAGIRQFTAGLLTFGASDAAMSKDEVAKAKAEYKKRHGRDVDVLLLPMTAGSVVLCYNLPDGPANLKLSRQAYLGIFLGKIDTWNDPTIASTNPGVSLPNSPITVVRRADGSGTTYAFTNHLTAAGKKVGKEWKWGAKKEWPLQEMIGGRGNPGVAALVQQTPGAIGYLEFGYAELAKLPMAVLENRAGQYVAASPESCQAALKGVELPDDFRIWLPDPAARDAYPIVTYTWLLCFTEYRDPEVANALKGVIRFCLTDGQKYSKELGYIPLPEAIAARILQAVDRIKSQ